MPGEAGRNTARRSRLVSRSSISVQLVASTRTSKPASPRLPAPDPATKKLRALALADLETARRRHDPEAIAAAARDKPASSALHHFVTRAAVALAVVLFVTYAPILNACIRMLDCEDIDFGGAVGVRPVLAAQRTLFCDEAEYARLFTLAVTMLGVYGLGVPVAGALLLKLTQYTSYGGDLGAAQRLFFFTTGALKPSRWFWESMLLTRKAAMIVCVVGIRGEDLKSLAAVWVSFFYFITTFAADPWDDRRISRLDQLGLLCVFITFNLLLLVPFYPEADAPGEFYTVIALVFAVNVLMLLAFAVEAVHAGRNKLLALGKTKPALFGWLVPLLEDSDEAALEKALARTAELRLLINELRRKTHSAHRRTAALEAVLEADCTNQTKHDFDALVFEASVAHIRLHPNEESGTSNDNRIAATHAARRALREYRRVAFTGSNLLVDLLRSNKIDAEAAAAKLQRVYALETETLARLLVVRAFKAS